MLDMFSRLPHVSVHLFTKPSILVAALVSLVHVSSACCTTNVVAPKDGGTNNSTAGNLTTGAVGAGAGDTGASGTGGNMNLKIDDNPNTELNPQVKDGNKTPINDATNTKFIFDRVMVIRQGESLNWSSEELQKFIEEKTGLKVIQVRKAALSLVQITFAPLDPPREEKDQKILVESLKDLGIFKAVEAEKIMTVK